MDKYEVRGIFEKTGRAVFISHLDLFRTMQRAMKRSKIPVWYSQGFNPRIYLNFPLALSLGVESRTEIMDFEIVEQVPCEKLLEDINKVLPEGLHFISMAAPVSKNKEIAFAEYVFDFYCEDRAPNEIAEKFNEMMSLDIIEVEKHSKKKGMVTIDIKPHINVVEKSITEDSFHVTVRLPAGTELNVNSNVFSEAFTKYSGLEFAKISVKRTKILRADGTDFA